MIKLHPMAIASSTLSIFLALGCEGGGSATEDPLAGKWGNEACYGSASTPPDVERCSVALTLTNALGVELEATWTSLAATATNPGCTTTRRVTGQTWSTDHAEHTLTVSGNGKATMERSGCVNATDNLEVRPTSDIVIRPGQMSYELDGDTLRVLTGSLRGTYTR